MSKSRKTEPLPLRELEAEARKVAGVVDSGLPEGVGFTILLFNFTDRPDDPNNFTTYISSADRETMKATLRELLEKWDSEGTATAPVKVETRPRTKWRFR